MRSRGSRGGVWAYLEQWELRLWENPKIDLAHGRVEFLISNVPYVAVLLSLAEARLESVYLERLQQKIGSVELTMRCVFRHKSLVQTSRRDVVKIGFYHGDAAGTGVS